MWRWPAATNLGLGHAFMLEDQTFTQRQVVKAQPGTCLHCHASMYVPYKKAGGGEAEGGSMKRRLPVILEPLSLPHRGR